MTELLGAMSADLSGDEDDPLHERVQSLAQEDKVGPDLDSKLQKMALDASKMREKEEATKVLRPGNCSYLAIPRVNPNIWFIMI